MIDYVRTAAWLVLLLLGVALSAIQLGSESSHVHPAHTGHGHSHEGQHRPQRLFFWPPEQAQVLTLRAVDGREQTFTRAPDGWASSTPAADESFFDPQEYVALLSQARKDREFAPDEGELHSFGLAPPKLRLQIRDAAGAVLADLSVGARTPDGLGRYVLMSTGANVLIIPNYQFEAPLKALYSDH